jgi:plasmid stabilization system protein ParE
MKIVWTHEALEHLTEIEDYISKESPERAARFVDQLIEHKELLSGKPRMGRTVEEALVIIETLPSVEEEESLQRKTFNRTC